MPDWAKEIRAAIAPLNLDPMREAEVVEELSQHLRDRYDEMLAGGTGAEQAYHSLLRELNDGTLVAGLKASLQVVHAPLPVGKDEKEGLFTGIWNAPSGQTTIHIRRGQLAQSPDHREHEKALQPGNRKAPYRRR
jgi:hypothetical protein